MGSFIVSNKSTNSKPTPVHLNTKGNCFICLKTGDNSNGTFPLHCFLRYLKPNKISNGLARRIDYLTVSLCPKCESLHVRFSELYQLLELIRMELTHYLETVQESMETSEFGKVDGLMRMETKFDKLNFDLVEEVRRIFLEKSREKIAIAKLCPVVKIQKLDLETLTRRSTQELESTEVQISTGTVALDQMNGSSSNELQTVDDDDDGVPIPMMIEVKLEKPESLEEDDPKLMKLYRARKPWGSRRNPPKSKFKCPHCEKVFASHLKMVYHRESSHIGIVFSCHKCQNVFPNREALVKHVCSGVPTELPSLKLAKRPPQPGKKKIDYTRLENGMRKCNICSAEYPSIQGIHYHFRVAHTTNRTQCQYCKFSFHQKWYATQHEKVCYKNPSVPIHLRRAPRLRKPPMTTGLKKPNPRKLETALINAASKKLYTCNICGKVFATSAGHHCHMASVHIKIRYKCDKCESIFGYKSSLKVHQREVCGKTPEERHNKYPCDMCEQKFSSQSGLQAHSKSKHLGVKYKCDVCQREFARKDNLKPQNHTCLGDKSVEVDNETGTT